MGVSRWACPGHVVVRKEEQIKAQEARQRAVHAACNDHMETLEGRRGLRRALAPLFLLAWCCLGMTTRAGALLSSSNERNVV